MGQNEKRERVNYRVQTLDKSCDSCLHSYCSDNWDDCNLYCNVSGIIRQFGDEVEENGLCDNYDNGEVKK